MANGCVPAEPIASPLAFAVRQTRRRRARSWSPASRVFAHGFVEISSTDSMSSGLISPSAPSSRSCSIALDELERLAVDDHQLLLDADRVALRGEVLVHARAERTRVYVQSMATTADMTTSRLEELLGDDAESLLQHQSQTFSKDNLHLPGPGLHRPGLRGHRSSRPPSCATCSGC